MTANGYGVLVLALAGAGGWFVGYPAGALVAAGCLLLLVPGLVLRLRRIAPYELTVAGGPTTVTRGARLALTVALRPAGPGATPPVRAAVTVAGTPVDRLLRPGAPAAPLPPVDATRRGRHPVRVVGPVCHDPFGLWRRRVTVRSGGHEVTVLPRLLPFPPPPPTTTTDEDGRPARRGSRGPVFAGLRGYLPGDDVRLIDWAATARQPDGPPLVRQHLPAEAGALLVVLDVDGPADRFEHCVDLAYCLLRPAARAGRPVALRTVLDGRTVERTGARPVTEALLAVRPCARRHPPGAGCLAALATRTPSAGIGAGPATTVLVSAAAPPGWAPARPASGGRSLLFRVGGAATEGRLGPVPPAARRGTLGAVVDVAGLADARDAWTELTLP